MVNHDRLVSDMVRRRHRTSEGSSWCNRRSSTLASGDREVLEASRGVLRVERDSSASSKLIMARPIRSLIRSAASTSSSRCSSFTNSMSSSSSFDRTCCLSVSDCFSCLSRRASPEIRISSVSLVTDPR